MLDKTITALVVLSIAAALAAMVGSGVATRIHEIIAAIAH
jgi:hypothetical protein